MIFSFQKKIGVWAVIYCLWATIAISFSIYVAGFNTESITRILVILFLLIQILFHSIFTTLFSFSTPKIRFIFSGTILAAVVEGFHMISKPVFLSLVIDQNTSFIQGLTNYLIDLAFTVPAYLLIFRVIFYFTKKFYFTLWQYIFVMGLAQTLGDGGIFFFIGFPAMLFFLPYPMTNYHAINVIPFLSVRNEIKENQSISWRKYVAIPGIVVTYLICGTFIKIIGKFWGFE